MNCQKCNAVNSDNAKFCKACGADCRVISAEKAPPPTRVNPCLKCGAENAAAAKFCKACGTLVAQVPAQVTAPLGEVPPPPHSLDLVPTQTPTPLLIAQPVPAEPVTPTSELPVVLPPVKESEPPSATVAPPPPPVPVPVPVAVTRQTPAAVTEPAPSQQAAPSQPRPSTANGQLPVGVACYKCKSLNSATAKFCKSCGVGSPSGNGGASTIRQATEPKTPRDKQPLLLWAGAAAALLVLLGGVGYWMFAGNSKAPAAAPVTPVAAEPVVQTAPAPPVVAVPAPAAVEAPAVPAVTDASAPKAPAASSASPVVVPEPSAAPAPAPAPATARAIPIEPPPPAAAARTEVPSGPADAEREAARKKQAERDAKARQLARDKAMLDKTNRTLDDLLKN